MSTNATPVVLNAPSVTEELKQAITSAIDPATLRAAIIAEAEKQAAEQTTTAAQVAAAKAETERQAAAQTQEFTRTEVIGGQEFIFTAPNELELERQITNALRVANALQSAAPVVEDVVDPAAVQRQAEEQAAAKAELDLKFKRGEISAKEYIQQSGAFDEYLAEQGIPVAELKNSVEQNQNKRFEQSWADATQEFLNSQGGADWPGGDRNLQLIGLQLQSMGLVEAEDKVGALIQAYQALKSTGMIFKEEPAAQTTQQTQQTQQTQKPQQTQTQQTQPAAQAQTQPQQQPLRTPAPAASSVFGASSGVGAYTATVPTSGAKVEISPTATGEEILDQWKKAQLASGKDPNAAFVETFSRR